MEGLREARHAQGLSTMIVMDLVLLPESNKGGVLRNSTPE